MIRKVPLAALDFETTGTDPATARPVQAALLLVSPEGHVLLERCDLIDPGCEIPAEASAIHGITTEKAKTGTPAAEAIASIAKALSPGGNFFGFPLVICNVPYDWPLLVHELGRHGLEPPMEPHFLDPLLLDRVVDKYRKGSRKLSDMAAHYRVTFDGEAHGARADALAAVGVTRKIAEKFPAFFEGQTLCSLQWAQRSHYEEWKAGINAYWRKQGKTSEVTNGWPA